MSRPEPDKSWVMVAIGASRQVKAWRTYEGMVWGATTYTVLGYYDGQWAHAVAEGRRLAVQEPSWWQEEHERMQWLARCDNYGEDNA
jgi:hypothetical protein